MLGVCLFVLRVSLGPERSACLHLPGAGVTNICHHAWLLAFILHRMWGSLDITCSSEDRPASPRGHLGLLVALPPLTFTLVSATRETLLGTIGRFC